MKRIISLLVCLLISSSSAFPQISKHSINLISNRAKIEVNVIGPIIQLAERTALKHGIDPALVLAIIKTESGYQANVIGPGGAGLMQLTKYIGRTYAKRLGFNSIKNQELIDPEINIEIGTMHLRDLLETYKEPKKALAIYYRGPDGQDLLEARAYAEYVIQEQKLLNSILVFDDLNSRPTELQNQCSLDSLG
jgi:soluble lytic murein transglycosylase-like protein